jgi:hypothetical protein
MKHNQKKYPDILTRFRKDVQDFSEKFGGVDSSKKGRNNKNNKFKNQVSRKEKRKLERKLKHAKNLAFRRSQKVNIFLF